MSKVRGAYNQTHGKWLHLHQLSSLRMIARKIAFVIMVIGGPKDISPLWKQSFVKTAKMVLLKLQRRQRKRTAFLVNLETWRLIAA